MELVVTLFISLIFTIILYPNNHTIDNQIIINRFSKGPVCIEQKVGKDNIKKCYELVEVTKE